MGDLKHDLSVMCSTFDHTAQGSSAFGLETGSDYRSRSSSHNSFITFYAGLTEINCSVKIIDDNLYEEAEEFEIILSDSHPLGKIHRYSKARVIINGPNDVPQVFIKRQDYEITHEQNNISISLNRVGVDLSKPCTVWCGTRSSLDVSGKNMNSLQQIKFDNFQSSVECQLSKNQVLWSTEPSESIIVFLDSPEGCILGEPNFLTVPMNREKKAPTVEFSIDHMVIKEGSGVVQISVLRTGDLTKNSSVYCVTHDDTAKAREDFEERYQTRRSSLINFDPHQKEAFCLVKIYDDDIHEGNEFLKLELISNNKDKNTIIANKKTVILEITDTEDATSVQLEKAEYVVSQHSFPNSSVSAVIPVIRLGDLRLISKIRVSTIDGSASAGLDYYSKSKLLTFNPGESKKHFEIEILYNKRRNWALSFVVILGPDEVLNADIGNISKAVITIPGVQSTESLILPAVPIVVSLLHNSNITIGLLQEPKPGYPLICITPCDSNYPSYAETASLCKESGINSSSMSYSWEVAMPLDSEENISPFESITYSTLFTSAHDKVLDSIYFRPHERVRCIVQPKDSTGQLGIPLQSKAVKINSETGFCHSTLRSQYSQLTLQSQSFIAVLEYIKSSDSHHPNKLHIHVEIPHEDGLLPLLSTHPLHNVEFLLSQNIYRQQHVCSNLLQSAVTQTEVNRGFLKSLKPTVDDMHKAFPYHGDQCSNETHLLYQHLDLKKCKWTFDAWYSMSELVELCGGSVTSDFKVRDTDQNYVTVLLPFFVTYVFAAAPTGWTTIERHTEMEFSFFYDTFLWKSGSHSDSILTASLTMVRVGTDSEGHVFFEFKTVAKFYGCFVLEHHTLPGIKSHISAPEKLGLQFELQLLWSEQTFDGPLQFWRATSNYNLKDYSGHYTVYLIPCKVTTSEQFSKQSSYKYVPCVAQAPQKFELPLAFQQTIRPEPVTYALETFFQLFNDESLFLWNPFENTSNLQYIEYKGSFSKGDDVYGRVFWSPAQQLKSAYQLVINEVILCAGKNGYIPIYDPTGKIYGNGPQYGCLLPNKNLKHKFTL
ncbi:Extracellular matrix protein FRAS1, partial [Stegodyphus mimosarum]